MEECRGFSSKYRQFIEELVLVIITVIVLIWMLNRSEECESKRLLIIHNDREFEINYRLSYHCSLLAAKDKKKILNLKNQV